MSSCITRKQAITVQYGEETALNVIEICAIVYDVYQQRTIDSECWLSKNRPVPWKFPINVKMMRDRCFRGWLAPVAMHNMPSSTTPWRPRPDGAIVSQQLNRLFSLALSASTSFGVRLDFPISFSIFSARSALVRHAALTVPKLPAALAHGTWVTRRTGP